MPRFVSLPLKAAALLLALTAAVAAQDYPTKPLRIIVPFPPGAFNDIVARLVATALSGRLGKQVIVENRAGAGGIIGAETVANAPKDGHTLLMVSIAHHRPCLTMSTALRPIKSFAPIAMLASRAQWSLVVNPSLAANSLDGTDRARQEAARQAAICLRRHRQRSRISAANCSSYTAEHRPAARAVQGLGPAPIDVVGGHTQPHVRRLLASLTAHPLRQAAGVGIGALQRNPLIPEVPTVAEAGVPGYAAANWFGIVAPAGTPAPRSSPGCTRRFPRSRTCPRCRSSSREGADIVRMSPRSSGLHRRGIGQMGPCREGRRHQAGVDRKRIGR